MTNIRPAHILDAPAIAHISIDTWRSAYAGIVPAEFLASLSYTERSERLRHHLETATDEDGFMLVAENAQGVVVGFASGGSEHTGKQPSCGEIYTLYVLDAHQKQGIGRELLVAGARQLALMGFAQLLIWTLAANPARRFYERLGGKLVSQRNTVIGGASLSEVGYQWETLAITFLPPAGCR